MSRIRSLSGILREIQEVEKSLASWQRRLDELQESLRSQDGEYFVGTIVVSNFRDIETGTHHYDGSSDHEQPQLNGFLVCTNGDQIELDASFHPDGIVIDDQYERQEYPVSIGDDFASNDTRTGDISIVGVRKTFDELCLWFSVQFAAIAEGKYDR